MRKCIDVSKASMGAFDVTVGTLSKIWDFNSGKELLPSISDVEEALRSVGYESVIISSNTVKVGAGQNVDFGAVGKGIACDYVKDYLEKSDVVGAVVAVGGSVLVYGKRNAAGDPWRVAVKHPRNSGEYLGVLTIKDGCVSTSGDYEKFFINSGKRYHHILNANTGYPADSGLISATVICDSGLLSDALSTACLALGKEKGEELCSKYGVQAVFVDKNLDIYTVGEPEFSR